MRTYTVYLSTLATSTNKPVDKSNLSRVKWQMNWKEIFGNRTGECRLRVRMISASSSTSNITWANNVGSLRGTFQSNCSVCSNGFNLGYVRPQSDYTGTNQVYIDSDTLTSNGASIVIPNSNSEFVLTFLNASENLMTNVPEYQIWLYFDVDDENPYYKGDEMVGVPPIFKPR